MIEKYLPDVCTIQYGFPFDSAQFSTYEGMPLIRIRDVLRGYSETFTTEKYKEEYIVYQNDLLIGMDGEFNIAKWGKTPALLNQRVCRLIPLSDLVDKNYLFYFMPSALKRIEEKTPFVTVKHLSAKELNKIKIPLPSLDEQRRIAAILDKVTDLINKRRAQLDKLDLLVKSRFVEMFGYNEKTTTMARYISELQGGKSLAGTAPCKNKVLKTGAATFGWFDPEQYKYLPVDYEPPIEHKVKTGDVIISRMNTPELVGACSYVFEAPENMYYPDRLWRAVLKENTNPIFLWQLLWERDIRKAIKEISGGTSGTMHNISKANLLAIKCVDVPIELQNQFAIFVEQIQKSKLILQQSFKELEALKKSLMQQYFG